MEVVGQESGTRAGQRRGEEGTGGRERDAVEVGELVAEDEERGRTDAHHARRQAVEAVDEVDRVDGRDDHDRGEQGALGSVEAELLLGADRDHLEPDARPDEEGDSDHLAAELGQGVELEEVVEHTDSADHRAGEDHGPGVLGQEGARAGEEGQLARHAVRRHEPAEHRQPAEVGDRLGVDVAVPDLRDRPGPERDLPGDHREEVGHRGRDQEDQEVLAHALSPRRSGWRPAAPGPR